MRGSMADVFKVPTISAPVTQPQAAGSALVGAVAVSSGAADAGKVLILDATGQIDPSFISGGGSQLYVNTVPVSNPNFQDSGTVTWSHTGSNIQASAASGAWAGLTGDLTESQVIPFDGGTPGTPDTGISRLGAASLAIGNGTNGNSTGKLTLASILAGTGTNIPAYGIASTHAPTVDNGVAFAAFDGELQVTASADSSTYWASGLFETVVLGTKNYANVVGVD